MSEQKALDAANDTFTAYRRYSEVFQQLTQIREKAKTQGLTAEDLRDDQDLLKEKEELEAKYGLAVLSP